MQFPLTFVYSLAPRLQNFPEIPTHRHIFVHAMAMGVFQIHFPVSGVNFPNNLPIPQVKASIKKTERYTTFEIS